MSNNQTASFQIREVDTFEIRIDLAIPPEKPTMRGHIFVDAIPRTKEEVRELSRDELDDEAYLRQLVHGIRGLGDKNGNPISGDDAFAEVATGKLSMWLMNAIIGAYFETFGEARRKNALPRRGR